MARMSAFDPKRTWLNWREKPFQSGHSSRYDAFVSASGAAMRRRDFIKFFSGAALWPLVFANLTFEIQGTTSIKELMRREVIQARDWQLVAEKARRESTDDDTTLRLDL